MDRSSMTITESELTDATLHFISQHRDMSSWNAMRDTLARLGITVAPDSIPEPQGDVIVVDAQTITWRQTGEGKWRANLYPARPWDELMSKRGPVKIYRLEGEAK